MTSRGTANRATYGQEVADYRLGLEPRVNIMTALNTIADTEDEEEIEQDLKTEVPAMQPSYFRRPVDSDRSYLTNGMCVCRINNHYFL